MASIGVVGAGIMGLSAAVAIQQRLPAAHVTIMAESFTVDTTSDGAGGLFVPNAPDTDVSLIRKWGKEGARHFFNLAFSEDSSEAGVYLSHGYELSTKPLEQLPIELEFALSHRRLNPEELKRFQPYYKDGFHFTTVIVEGRKYLPWITARFREKGGHMENRRVQSFDELCGRFDVVVNCSGLGSIKLVPDPLLKPLRGQVIRVHAPWIKFFVRTDNNVYILPSSENVAVGGTREADEYDVTPNPDVSKQVFDRVLARIPAIKGAKTLWEWVGLRPYRCPPRVESEIRRTADGRPIKIVHNYGHGSFGISLSWGTGVHVAQMVSDLLHASPKL
ncbi:D-aspartate oxidase-like isoform X2 [Littorina saxatilis]|uniref:FAD dependent oxidoreductase domain-containing protein n=1 Tax=Littorina saxatilis TaxID=31220 RepID=A0AAN9BZL9_9CAEN